MLKNKAALDRLIYKFIETSINVVNILGQLGTDFGQEFIKTFRNFSRISLFLVLKFEFIYNRLFRFAIRHFINDLPGLT